MEDVLDRWVDWSMQALDRSEPTRGGGFDALVGPTLTCLRGVLDISLGPLLSHQRVAFCYPDHPMRYPAGTEEFWSAAGTATFVVQTLEHYGEFFTLVRDRFAQRWRGRVHVACYVSPSGMDRFGPHRDEWNVAALLIAGQKLFRFQAGEPINLSPGCVLAIPQGLVHHAEDPAAESQQLEHSIHLSVALH